MARYSMTQARWREARALELAKDGLPWADISEELGYRDRSGAHKAAQRALKRRAADAADQYLGAELVDLDCIIERNWPAAATGSVRAAEVVLRAMDRRGRLLDRIVVPEGEGKRGGSDQGPRGREQSPAAAGCSRCGSQPASQGRDEEGVFNL